MTHRLADIEIQGAQRRYYFDLEPDARRYFLDSGHDDLPGVAANTGRHHTRWRLFPTPPLGVSALFGAAAAGTLAAAMVRQQAGSWARADARAESIFPSSGAEEGAQ